MATSACEPPNGSSFWWNAKNGTGIETDPNLFSVHRLPQFLDKEKVVSPRLGDTAAALFYLEADEKRRERNAKRNARNAQKAANSANPTIPVTKDEERFAAFVRMIKEDLLIELLEGGPEIGINPKYLSDNNNYLGGFPTQKV